MKICIDPGHNYSGFDTGASGNGLQEQIVTFVIADRLRKLLEDAGLGVIMTRETLTDNVGVNASDSINGRARIANSAKCDLFISIHCNAGGGTGTETLVCGKGGKAENLAKCVNDRIVNKFGLKDRGVKVRPDLGVLRLTRMPAILIETAFIDHKNDSRILKNNQKDFAEVIANGIFEFLGIKERIISGDAEEIVARLMNIIEITEPEKAISHLKKAKENNSSLYWMLYKISELKGELK